MQVKDSDSLCLITHTHLDHSGGIDLLIKKNIPVIVSSVTARIMILRGLIDNSLISKNIYVFNEQMRDWLAIGKYLKIKALMVPHAPGSTGYLIKDSEKCLFFPGDISFKTYRHNFLNIISDEFSLLPTNINKYLMVDGTMIGRKQGANENKVAENFFSKVKGYKNIVICSLDIEQLLYAYLDLFYFGKNNNRGLFNFVISKKLKPIFQFLHISFIRRSMNDIDPYILSQYGKEISSWAESRWLFWLDDNHINNENKNIYFMDFSDLDTLKDLPSIACKGIGRMNDERVSNELNCDILEIDSSPWSLHSSEQVIQNLIYDIDKDVKFLFFHNFEKRMKKFIKNNNIEHRGKALYKNFQFI